jgi:formylglycine-generating enzyme required for sulfatase activity/WD40 repeat protein
MKRIVCSLFTIVCAVVAVLCFPGCRKKAAALMPEAPLAQIMDDVAVSRVAAVTFSADGEYLLTASEDGLLRVWEVNIGAQIAVFEAQGTVRAAAFSPGGKFLAAGIDGGGEVGDTGGDTGGEYIQVWNVSTGEVYETINTGGTGMVSLVYGKDGTIVTLGEDGKIRSWDRELESERPSGLSAFSRAVLAGGGNAVMYARENRAALWDAAEGREVRALGEYGGPVSALALSPDGAMAAAAAAGGIAMLNAKNGKITKTFPNGDGDLVMAFNHDNGYLALGLKNGTTRLLDTATGREVIRYIGLPEKEWISMTPNGYYNASRRGASMFSLQVGDETNTLEQMSGRLLRIDKIYNIVTGQEKNPDDPLADTGPKPPVVEIMGPRSLRSAEGTVSLRVRITAAEGHGAIKVFNGDYLNVPGIYSVEETIDSQRTEGNKRIYEVILPVSLNYGKNSLKVAVYNQTQQVTSQITPASSAEVQCDFADAPREGPVLHILLAAVAKYKEKAIVELAYTKNDAEKILEIFERQKNGTLYARTEKYELFDEGLTREAFIDMFDRLKNEVKPEDGFVFFYAGHGSVDEDKDFYLVPWDSIPGSVEKDITKWDLIENIGKIRAKNSLILLDACRSGALIDMQSAFTKIFGEMRQKAVIVASLGDQKAAEASNLGHGVFTYSLLKALEGDAIQGEKRFITVQDLINFVNNDVPATMRELLNPRKAEGEKPVVLAMRDMDFSRKSKPVIQKPAAFPPENNFEIVDLKYEPCEVTLETASSGSLEIIAMAGTHPVSVEEVIKELKAGEDPKPVQRLKEGSYTLTMLYTDGEKEPKLIKVENNTRQDVAFTHVPMEPGVTSIRGRSAGVLAITRNAGGRQIPVDTIREFPANREITRTFDDEGNYTFTMTYPDSHAESLTRQISKNSSVTVAFTYEFTVPEGMVLVPGGSFMMGSPANEQYRRDNETRHSVTVRAFYLGAREVTQGEYSEVMGTNPAINKGNNLPVENVTWLDAIGYCNARSQRENLRQAYQVRGRQVTPVPGANGYRLPTEAEWEYACRANTSGAYYTGNSITGSQANFKGTGTGHTVRTGGYPPNPFKLYDMAGNVWEWCWDYVDDYGDQPRNNPTGPDAGERRVTRGGSWSNEAAELRSAYRGSDVPSFKGNNLGFRVARSTGQ